MCRLLNINKYSNVRGWHKRFETCRSYFVFAWNNIKYEDTSVAVMTSSFIQPLCYFPRLESLSYTCVLALTWWSYMCTWLKKTAFSRRNLAGETRFLVYMKYAYWKKLIVTWTTETDDAKTKNLCSPAISGSPCYRQRRCTEVMAKKWSQYATPQKPQTVVFIFLFCG